MRLSIGRRLFIGFFALLFLEIFIVGLGIFNIRRLAILNQRSLNLITPMERVYGLLLSFQGLVMPANNYLASANIVEKEIFKLQVEQVNQDIARVREIFPKEEEPEFIRIAKESFQQIIKMAENIFQLDNPRGSIEGAMLMEEMDAFMDKGLAALDEYHEEYLDKQLDVLKLQGIQIVKNARFLFFSFSFFGVILSILSVYLLSRRIHKPIISLQAACKKISKGNMDTKIKLTTADEFEDLANTFNRMVEDLKENKISIEKANRELAELNRVLEQKVEERTKELKNTQAKLIQSAKMAAVGQLAGGVAHEINNPLTGVLNNVQLLKLELEERKCSPSEKELKNTLDIVEDSALRCQRIVQSLLDFSRVHKKAFLININETIEKTFVLAESEIKLKDIAIIRDFAPNLPSVMADPTQLQQVFLDIFDNAKWAMREKKGNAQLNVKTFLSQDKKYVVTEISDNGCGIERQNLSRMFEPFFTTKGPGEGTGLGLSICYGIIKEHNGSIEIESEGKDKGTTVRISLPAPALA